MTARRHHFVPQCYLKGFAAPRKQGTYQSYVFDRKTGKSFQTTIENIALERDFNRIDIEGVEPDAFEARMSKFESELALALERTTKANVIQNDADKNLIFNLIGVLALRNPRWRETIRKVHADVSKMMMDLALATKERWEGQIERATADGAIDPKSTVTYEEMKNFHESGEYKIKLNSVYQIQLELDGVKEILPLIAQRKWVLLRAHKDSGGFVTTDHPVSLMWSDPARRGGFYGPGFGLKGTEVLFPLSSRLALVGAFELQDDVIDVGEEIVATANGVAIAFASRQVYARDLHFRYKRHGGDLTRKASRLIDDATFFRKREKVRQAAPTEGGPNST